MAQTILSVLASRPTDGDGEWVFVQFGVSKDQLEEFFHEAHVPTQGGVVSTRAGENFEARWLSTTTKSVGLLPVGDDSSDMKAVSSPLKWLRIGNRGHRPGPYHCGDHFLRHAHIPSHEASSSSTLQVHFATSDNTPISRIKNTRTCVASFEFPVRDVNTLTFERQDVKLDAKRERRRFLQCNRESVRYSGELACRGDKIFLGRVKKKRLTLFPTEYYSMKVHIVGEETIPEEEAASWFESRNEAIDLFAAAKRKRLVRDAKKKRITDEEVANLQEAKVGLQAKIDENALQGNKDSALEEGMRQVLPEWNADATEARNIYHAGLEKVFQPKLIDTLSYPTMLVKALTRPAFFNDRSEPDMWTATQSKTLHSMLKCRHLAFVIPEHEMQAKMYAQQMQVVLSLIYTYKVCRHSKGFSSKNDAERAVSSALRDTASNSTLASLFVDTFFEESGLLDEQGKRTCVLDSKKLLCHLVVLVLSLVPKCQFDFKDVATDLNETADALKVYLEYVGCLVNTSSGLDATLQNTFVLRRPRLKARKKKKL